MSSQIEATQALASLVRERRAAGLPGLNELQAAMFLGTMAELRRLPEVSRNRGLVSAPRRSGLLRRSGRLVVSRTS
jgi:transposase